MTATVIYGPMATGKTHHRDRFAAYYGTKRIIEADEPCMRRYEPRNGDLILSNAGFLALSSRFPHARLIPIDTARRAIGLDPAPKGGFRR